MGGNVLSANDIVLEASKDSGIQEDILRDVLYYLLEFISDHLSEGDRVYISGFGTFSARDFSRRVVVPKTGEPVYVQTRSVVFRPSYRLRRVVASGVR